MQDIAGFARETVAELDEKLKDIASRVPPRAMPGVRAPDHGEPQGLLLLGARGPRLRLCDLEGQGRQADVGERRQGADQDRLHRAARDGLSRALGPQLPRAPGLSQTEEGKWRVEFNEAWAKEGAKPPDHETVKPAEAEPLAAGSAA